MINNIKSCETMNTKFDDTLFDFDLNFLQQSPVNVVNENKIEKQQKALLIAKKKTIATDSLIKKYYAKQEQLEQCESILLAAKEECKQVCIDYKNTLERCTILEKEVENLKIRNDGLESKLVLAQNQCDAFKSHAHQLQLLVKEHETKIEALVVEKQLVKNNGDSIHNATLQKENEVYLSHIYLLKDIVLGKKKIEKQHRLILRKYRKNNRKKVDHIVNYDDSDSLITPSDLSIASTDIKLLQGDNLFSNILQKKEILESINYKTNIKDLFENCGSDDESDCSNNEFISEDTGCGSSITVSEGEKCLNSPDYFINDSPLETEHLKIKSTPILVETASSPIPVLQRNDIATSPITFDNDIPFSSNINVNIVDSSITDTACSTEMNITEEKRTFLDASTSPICNIEKFNVATSPVIFIDNSLSCDNIKINSNSIQENETNNKCNTKKSLEKNALEQRLSDNLSAVSKSSNNHEFEICEKSVLEKRCLERHNSKNLLHENNSDEEIEMILNTMRLSHEILTPIPKTPCKSGRKRNSDSIVIAENCESHPFVCPDVAKICEDNKTLHLSIANLSKEIFSIKCMLQNQVFSREYPSIEINAKGQQVNMEINDITSQKTLVIDNKMNDKHAMFERSTETLNTVGALKSIELLDTEKQCDQGESNQSDRELELMDDEDNLNLSTSDINHAAEATSSGECNVESVNSDCIIFQGEARIEMDDSNHTKYSRNNFCTKNVKRKKISKLDKLKNKCLPKYKISKALTLTKNRRPKPKPKSLSALRCNNKSDASVLLNNKSAYENALKVMSEIKSKEKKNESNVKHISPCNMSRHDSQTRNPNTSSISLNIDSATLGNSNSSPIMAIDMDNTDSNSAVVEDKVERKNKAAIKDDKVILPVDNTQSIPVCNKITTRSSSKKIESHELEVLQTDSKISDDKNVNNKLIEKNNKSSTNNKFEATRKQLKRKASTSPEKQYKRVLRSSKEICANDSTIEPQSREEDTVKTNNKSPKSMHKSSKVSVCERTKVAANVSDEKILHNREVVQYTDFDENIGITANNPIDPNEVENKLENSYIMHNKDSAEHNKSNVQITEIQNSKANERDNLSSYPKNSILCHMIEKYGKKTIRHAATKVSDKISSSICKKLEDDIANIIQLQSDKSKPAMNKLVEDIQKMNFKSFMAGFMLYLKDPARKRELFNKVNSPPAPPMTKQEQIILYIVNQINGKSLDAVNMVLTNIEFSLFQLNRTPDFDVVESISHLYALICRYFGLKHRVRLFILDAMYCLQFKVIPIIKQCLEVWMHILPLAHMGIAKTPLVTCLVYLLHFYKCEDRCNRVADIRFILSKKYFYQITDWNEMKILEMFRNAIRDVKDVSVEIKILRTALIILAKRLGAKWCQKNIIKNILLPMIEENVSEKAKRFCVTMLGPLMKPFPTDMKIHCEIMVNQLLDMLEQNPSDNMKEAIFTSLIYMNKHNQFRVTQALLLWEPPKISKEFEDLLRDFVREKPIKTWLKLLPKMT